MIQRIIDWYNGYTLEDKLELEWLLKRAKELALDDINKLNPYVYQELSKGNCNWLKRAIVVNTNVLFYKNEICDIKRQLLLLQVPGAIVRVRLDFLDFNKNIIDSFKYSYPVEEINIKCVNE